MSEDKKEQTQSKDKKGGVNWPIIIIGAIIIVLLVAVIVILLLKKDPVVEAPKEEGTKREVLVTEDNVKEIAKEMEKEVKEYVPPGMYTATMNFTWHFASGDAESTDSYVANDPENTNDIYFDVFLQEDEENAIYESPVIPRGSELRNIRLKKELDPGTYDCILVYHLIDEEQNTMSTASFTLKIIIGECKRGTINHSNNETRRFQV